MVRSHFKISSMFTGALLLATSAYSHAQYDCANSYEWSSSGYFLVNDVVHYKGVGYKAKMLTSNQRPDQSGTNGPWEKLGYCTATKTVTCDFNGDGQLDSAKGFPLVHLVGGIISSPGTPTVRDYKDFLNTGEVSITYGNTSPNAAPDKIWNQNGLGMFPYAKPYAQFGSQLTTGDFNNDTFCDLAISAPGFSNKGWTPEKRDEGLINILYGSPNGLTIIVLGESGRPINPFDAQRFDQDSSDVPEVAEPGDRFGDALAAGDFNGDGFDDIAIGVPAEATVVQQVTLKKVGYVNILFGSKRGIQTSTPRATGFFQNVTGPLAPEVEDGDLFGGALAAADFDKDGYTDLAISAPSEDIDTLNDHKGKITVLRGYPYGFDPTTKKHFTLKNIIAEQNPRYYLFGASLSTNFYNGDSFPDLEIVSGYCSPGTPPVCSNQTFRALGSASGLVTNN